MISKQGQGGQEKGGRIKINKQNSSLWRTAGLSGFYNYLIRRKIEREGEVEKEKEKEEVRREATRRVIYK